MATDCSLTPREALPWSKNQLRRLGETIRDATDPPAGTPDYTDVMLWYNELAAAVRTDIEGMDWAPYVDGAHEVTARAKTIGTLREKLQRRRTTPLPNVQDVAGVRFEAEMTLSQQDEVAATIAAIYDQPPGCIKDLRANPNSGYRAVHVNLRLEAPVEVQVRTHHQGTWANTYERLADVLGRHIRYDGIPADDEAADLVRMIQGASMNLGARLEKLRDEHAHRPPHPDDVAERMDVEASYTEILQELDSQLATSRKAAL